MLETIMHTIFNELVFKTLLAILLTSIYFQSFLGLATCTVAMGTQTAYLINAAIVSHLTKLHIDLTLPFPPVHVIIACMFGICRIKQDSGNHYTTLITKQIQRVSADGNDRQTVRITTQSADEITVGNHLTHATIVFIKHRGSNHDAMLDRIWNINQIIR